MDHTLANELQADFWLTQVRKLECEEGKRECGPHPLDYSPPLTELTAEEIEEAQEVWVDYLSYWREVV